MPLQKTLFSAFHQEKLKLRNQDELRHFFSDQGIAPDIFNKAYNAFSTETSINRAHQLARYYDLRATPSLVVNGKYLVPASSKALAIVDFLIDQEMAASD